MWRNIQYTTAKTNFDIIAHTCIFYTLKNERSISCIKFLYIEKNWRFPTIKYMSFIVKLIVIVSP